MTPEEKQLLLKDLCARLPHGVIVHVEGSVGGNYLCGDSTLIGVHNGVIHVENAPAYGNYEGLPLTIDIKPYLRPMSSMTEEEFNEYMQFIKHSWEGIDKEEDDYYVKVKDRDICTDWLLSHNFDYRGLIPMGLALEAPDGMYKTE